MSKTSTNSSSRVLQDKSGQSSIPGIRKAKAQSTKRKIKKETIIPASPDYFMWQ